MADAKRVALVAPLDWGLGHATRCIPLIELLLQQNWRVVLCADDAPLALLQNHFPQLEWRKLPPHNIRYPKKRGAMFWLMLFQLPKIILGKWRDHQLAKRWSKELGATLLISDNRSGFFNRSVRSIYLTHQLRIAAPKGMQWGEPILALLHSWMTRPFHEIWIPDLPSEPNLAGRLSRGWRPHQHRYIGLLTRFGTTQTLSVPSPIKEGYLVLLSGPEPQRSLLEEKVATQFIEWGERATIVRGLPIGSSPSPINSPLLRWIPFLSAEELEKEMRRAALLICRSGYSTLMDLTALEIKALYIPTPGQTEQEYLASRLGEQFGAVWSSQNELQISQQLPLAEKSSPLSHYFNRQQSQQLLEEAIRSVEQCIG